MEKLKALIFDLDGTLGDTLPLCIKAFRHAIEPLIQRTISDAEIIATFGPSEEGTIQALAPDHYEKGVADYLHYYEHFHDLCPTPFTGIRDLLDSLRRRGVRLAMVTGKGVHSTAISLKRFQLEDYFELVETGWAAGPRKPACLQKVIQTFADIQKEEMVYVGDSPSDIESSRSVGLPVVGAAWASTTNSKELAESQPDELFDAITVFADWVAAKTS